MLYPFGALAHVNDHGGKVSPTCVECARAFGASHRAYGWAPQPRQYGADPAMLAAYTAGYNEESL